METESRRPGPKPVLRNKQIAERILQKVLRDKLELDQAIQLYFKDGQSKSDRDWNLEVVSGTLRNKSRLELAIDAYAQKRKSTGQTRNFLLLAAYQLIEGDDLPRPAIVSEWVEAVKTALGIGPSKYANAVLRKVAGQAAQWKALAINSAESSGLPNWIWSRLVVDWGLEGAVNTAKASLSRPKFFLYGGRSDLQEWLDQEKVRLTPVEEKSDVQNTSVRDDSLVSAQILETKTVLSSPELRQGKVWVQDIAAQRLVSNVVAHLQDFVKESAANPAEKIQWLDLCGAPGGKILAVYRRAFERLPSSQWNNISWTVTDKHSKRFEKMKSDLESLPVLQGGNFRENPIRVKRWNDIQNQKFDWIWVDAPCTGTGVMRKHPEIRWIKSEAQMQEILNLQQEALEFALSHLRKNGIIIYTVCSVLKAEGFGVTEKIFSSLKHPVKTLERWEILPDEGDGFLGGMYQIPDPQILL